MSWDPDGPPSNGPVDRKRRRMLGLPPVVGLLPRTVDRLEALQALEWGSVILDRSERAWQLSGAGSWGSPRHEWTYTPAEFIAAITGPYTLIWEPT